MTFTLFPTIITGDPWTAANANTYWRDNLNMLGGGVASQVLGFGPAWIPGNGIQLISAVELSTDTASVDFTSIPTDYTHLQLMFQAGTDDTAQNNEGLRLTFNNDLASSNYAFQRLDSYYVTPSQHVFTQTYTGENAIIFPVTTTYQPYDKGQFNVIIFNYQSTVFYKHLVGQGDNQLDYYRQTQLAGEWLSAAAINRITLFPLVGTKFVTSSVFSLYGLM